MNAYFVKDFTTGNIFYTTDKVIVDVVASNIQSMLLLFVCEESEIAEAMQETARMGSVLPTTRRASQDSWFV